MSELVTVTIDGQELQVPKGTLVIRAAEELGITIPRFCDHPLLDPVGACRQCFVEVEGQRKPFTSCTTTCTEGMVVKTHLTSEVARQAQEGNLELLLINHPLDCPQCDKGGECPLQDQTLAHGPGISRFIDDKRRYIKPLPISALVALDRERCVLCARCTRFSSEISGDPFIELFERGALEQVAIYEDEPYESHFSGNVIQICPVGALTSSTYRFKSRPFDLTSHPTVCNQCSAGCNLRADVRRGEIARQLARENMAVNEMWNCDRGRFGYEFVAAPERLRVPVARNELGSKVETTWFTALRDAASRLKAALEAGGPTAVGVLTGGRLTDEDSYALSRFARDVLGTDNVDFRQRPRTDDERGVFGALAGTMGPTYDDVEAAPLVVVAGLDPEEEVPILHLRLRKAWRRHSQRIVVVGPNLGSLADIAWRWVRTMPGAEAEALQRLAAGGESEDNALNDVMGALGEAGAATVVLAGERLALSPGALPAAAALATGTDAAFGWVPRRTNARGAVDAGLVPGLLPGGRPLDDPGPVGEAWNRLPEATGMDTREMLTAAAAGEIKALYLVGVDPVRDFEDPRLARAALEAVDSVIVQDVLTNDSTAFADVVLPAMVSQERVGSFTTWEGRRQPFGQALQPQGLTQHDWDIVRQLALAMGSDLGWESANDVRREASPLMEAAGDAGERLAALPAPSSSAPAAPPDDHFAVVVVDRLLGSGTMLAGAKALQATARPEVVEINEADARRLDITSGRHVTVVGSAGSLELPAKVSAGVVPGCVVLPGTSNGVAAATLVEPEGALVVRLEPAEGFSDVERPTPQDVAAQPSDAGQLRPTGFGMAASGGGPEDTTKVGGGHPVREGSGRILGSRLMDWVDVLIIVVKAVVAFAIWILATAMLIWGERRVVAKMQTRIGPNRLGPFGILQTVADGAKLFFKEDITPRNIDRWVYIAAPFVSAVVAMVTFAVVPFGNNFAINGREIQMQVWDPEIGLLWFLAMSSLGVYGIVLAGWSSGSKYPLLGAVRSSAQMISYELAMGLSLAAVFIHTGTLQSSGIVEAQRGFLFSIVPAWNVIPMIPAFVVFFVAIVAETQRPPFDLPEAEGELVAGFHTEYSGAKFAMFFLAEFMNVITVSAVTVTAFLGGPSGPVPDAWEGTIASGLLGFFYFAVKTFVFVFIFIWLRGTLPRTRYDRLMVLGWKVLLPFSLAWVMITAVVVLWREAPPSWMAGSSTRYILIGIAAAAGLWLIAPVFSRGGRDDDDGPAADHDSDVDKASV